jgi:hypothetical protein
MGQQTSATEWPALVYSEWENTRDTLHMWTQIVGKTRMAKEPLNQSLVERCHVRHPDGLTTSSIPYRGLALKSHSNSCPTSFE